MPHHRTLIPKDGGGFVVQLNISDGGLPKRPIQVATVSSLGILGDRHLYRFHGGPQKALLLMAAEVIDQLATEGFAVGCGTLGENLTVGGLEHRNWRSGQRYRVGTCLIELTDARPPCSKLRPYGKGIEKRILQTPGESGFYAAVLEGGSIAPGDTIQLVDPVVTYAHSSCFNRSGFDGSGPD